MNVLKKLHREHEAVNSILNEMEEAAFWAKWVSAVKRFGRSNVRLIAAGPQAHAARLAAPEPIDEHELVKSMKAALERHIREEESEVWRNIRGYYPAEQRARLDARFLAARHRTQQAATPVGTSLFARPDGRIAEVAVRC